MIWMLFLKSEGFFLSPSFQETRRMNGTAVDRNACSTPDRFSDQSILEKKSYFVTALGCSGIIMCSLEPIESKLEFEMKCRAPLWPWAQCRSTSKIHTSQYYSCTKGFINLQRNHLMWIVKAAIASCHSPSKLWEINLPDPENILVIGIITWLTKFLINEAKSENPSR